MKQLSGKLLNYLNEEKRGNSTTDECIMIPTLRISDSLSDTLFACHGRLKSDGTKEWQNGHVFSTSENNRRKEMIKLLFLLSNIPFSVLTNGNIIAMNVHKSHNFLNNVRIILCYMSVDVYYYSSINSNIFTLRHMTEKENSSDDAMSIIMPETATGLITITRRPPLNQMRLEKRLLELGGTDDIAGISHEGDYIPSFFYRFPWSGWQSRL